VLVVEDEPDLRELLRVCLSFAGHEVRVAADGSCGLLTARQWAPEVILLDVMMPVLDGWSVLSALKQDPATTVSRIPVVMLTARAEDLDLVRGSIEGAVGYLTKPFSIQEVRAEVAKALAGKPEPEQRRAAQQAALVHLARLERGTALAPLPVARPHMSRLEPVTGAQSQGGRHGLGAQEALEAWPRWLDLGLLTKRDREILETSVMSRTLSEARHRLGVSRSYVYARLRHMASKLEFESGPALVQALKLSSAHGPRAAGTIGSRAESSL